MADKGKKLNKTKTSLTGKVSIVILTIMVSTASMQWLVENAFLSSILTESLLSKGTDIAALFSKLSVAPLRRLDYATIQGNAKGLRENEDVLSVSLFDTSGSNLTPFATVLVPAHIPTSKIRREVLDELGNPLGSLEILFSLKKVQEGIERARIILLAAFLLTLLLSWIAITLMLKSLIITPIRLVVRSMDFIAHGDLAQTVPVKSKDEIGMLAKNFNSMTEKLKSSLDNQLRSEKLAALGGLVAGVAHEINTPIGVCITAVSFLEEISKSTRDLIASGDLTKETFDAHLTDIEQASTIVRNNLDQAAKLIRSFKQISTDQSSEQRRVINLSEYLNEIASSLKHELKKANISVQIECLDNVNLDLFPGPLSQIITILIMNARIHAFEEAVEGTISIQAGIEGEFVTIKISDNGCGMDSSVQSKIFNPFFTTKRGSGGTGLGLYILYNIVHDHFGGTVSVDSKLRRGTSVMLNLPINGTSIKHPNGYK